MAKQKVSARNRKAKPVRQSVTLPGPLATQLRHVAKERNLTVSRTLVALAERGLRAEFEAREHLKSTYQRFTEEHEPTRKEEAGRDLIRAIFGKDAIAQSTVL